MDVIAIDRIYQKLLDMDDKEFNKILNEHKNGDIAQIVREKLRSNEESKLDQIKKIIEDAGITHSEQVYQNDKIQEALPEIILDICKVIYYDNPDF